MSRRLTLPQALVSPPARGHVGLDGLQGGSWLPVEGPMALGGKAEVFGLRGLHPAFWEEDGGVGAGRLPTEVSQTQSSAAFCPPSWGWLPAGSPPPPISASPPPSGSLGQTAINQAGNTCRSPSSHVPLPAPPPTGLRGAQAHSSPSRTPRQGCPGLEAVALCPANPGESPQPEYFPGGAWPCRP